MRARLRTDALYNATLEWMHFQTKSSPTKTDIANYWVDHHGDAIGDAKGAALTDAVVFFMRMVGVADLGKFVAACLGRETHIKVDASKLAEFAIGEWPTPAEDRAEEATPATPAAPTLPAPAAVRVGTGLNVNVEIHIAADAKPSTVEEIFKNMRKYLIDGPDSSADGN